MKVYIIKTVDYQEHSRLMYGLSDQGMVSMLARGVKKMNHPLRHLAHPGMLLDVTLTQGKLPTVKDATVVSHYPAAKADLVKLTVHHLCGEIVYHNVTQDDDYPKLFTFMQRTFQALETHPNAIDIALLFELKMLAFLGFALGFSRQSQRRAFNHSTYEIEPIQATHTLLEETIYEDFRLLYYADVSDLKPRHFTIETQRMYLEITHQLYLKHLDFKAQSKALLLSFL